MFNTGYYYLLYIQQLLLQQLSLMLLINHYGLYGL